MADAALLWAADLAVSPEGDIVVGSGSALGQQRVLRRLLTNPGDYIWQPQYGAGLGKLVGATTDVLAIRSVIRSQIFQEPAVSRSPAPVIDVETGGDGSIYVYLRYVDATDNSTQILSFSVGP